LANLEIKFTVKNKSPLVDGLVNDIEIANHFANKFQDICTPYSPNKNAIFSNVFKHRFLDYVGDSAPTVFNTENVDNSIMRLKKGKAADYDGLSAEHFQYAHPSVTSIRLHVDFSLLCFTLVIFQMLLVIV